jgi:hypothetical protein
MTLQEQMIIETAQTGSALGGEVESFGRFGGVHRAPHPAQA